MRRFLLTIPNKFKGAVEAQYNSNGKLWKMDFSKVELAPEVLSWFKKGIPVLAENLEQYAATTGVVIVTEVEFEVTFEDFMREYPYKRNTHLARIHWPKMTAAQQYQAFLAASEYRKFLVRNEWQKPKIADKWLKEQQFLNDWANL